MGPSLDTLAFSGTELTEAQLEQVDGGMMCLLIFAAIFYAGLIGIAATNM